MSTLSVDNLKKTTFHTITESKYWELAHEILSFFKLSTEALKILNRTTINISGVC